MSAREECYYRVFAHFQSSLSLFEVSLSLNTQPVNNKISNQLSFNILTCDINDKTKMYLSRLTLCVIFVLLCSLESRANLNDDIPLTKLGSKTGPTLKFFYCYSCGYRKVFEDYVNILRQKYPELQIDGENYNPPGINMNLAKFLGILKILVILFIFSKSNIFQWFNQPMPFWWQWCMENRLYSSVILFFACNAAEGYLISSGAFEIHFNDVPIWSKLETGRIPQPPELFQIIDSQLQMQFPEMEMELGRH